MSKTQQELAAMKTEELVEYVGSLSAQVDEKEKEAKKAMEEKEHEAKKAMEEKEHEAKQAMEDKEKEHEATKQAVMKAVAESAMDEDEKKAVLKAMGDDDKKHDAKYGMENDEEKKALQAQVTYLADKIKTPQVDYLTKVYQAALTPEATIKEYVAEWNNKTPQQLDAEIKKLGPLVQTITNTRQLDAGLASSPELPAMTTLPTSKGSYSGAVDFSKIDKMSDAELFGKVGN